MPSRCRSRALRGTAVFALTLLLIEFFDEFVYGAREAAWPLIRTDLTLTYAQIGLLQSLPNLIGNLAEPSMGILGDVWKRRALILGGGLAFALALVLVAVSRGFPALLAGFVLLYPASGAFVTLSQATLMDIDPLRHEQNMARWTLAGSVGVVVGSAVLGVATAAGLGWRGLFLLFAGLGLILVAVGWRFPLTAGRPGVERAGFVKGVVHALRSLRRGEVLRWLTLLQFSDLMMDVLLGFLALYFVDVVGASPTEAGMAVAVWTGAGLVGGLLIIPLLERVEGLYYLRFSAAVELMLFAAFLLVPGSWSKVVLLGGLGLFNAGWYSIPKAQLYSAMPGKSGTVMTLGNIFGLVGSLIPYGLGLVAEQSDLRMTMWVLALGPVALLVGIPKDKVGTQRAVPPPDRHPEEE